MGLIGICVDLVLRFRETYHYPQLLGAICWLLGNIFLLQSNFYPKAVPFWIAFLFLTILSERMELSRFLPLKTWQKNSLWAVLSVFVLGLFLPYHWGGVCRRDEFVGLVDVAV
jgi:hypothetical protein